jgi:hypothetical protein
LLHPLERVDLSGAVQDIALDFFESFFRHVFAPLDSAFLGVGYSRHSAQEFFTAEAQSSQRLIFTPSLSVLRVSAVMIPIPYPVIQMKVSD